MLQMDPIFKMPASPGLPLFPISPDRTNRQQSQQIPTSTTRTSISPIRERDILSASHVRGSSDVQNKVAQFNNLTKEAAQRRKDTEAALKRAVVGREEAESETRRLKEENDILRREIEEGRNRERRVGERLENVMVNHVLTCAVYLSDLIPGGIPARKGESDSCSISLRERGPTSQERSFQIVERLGKSARRIEDGQK